jgi:hypothetical protein
MSRLTVASPYSRTRTHDTEIATHNAKIAKDGVEASHVVGKCSKAFGHVRDDDDRKGPT